MLYPEINPPAMFHYIGNINEQYGMQYIKLIIRDYDTDFVDFILIDKNSRPLNGFTSYRRHVSFIVRNYELHHIQNMYDKLFEALATS